jgi:hypothetical protein
MKIVHPKPKIQNHKIAKKITDRNDLPIISGFGINFSIRRDEEIENEENELRRESNERVT